jgi:hypothetical protein
LCALPPAGREFAGFLRCGLVTPLAGQSLLCGPVIDGLGAPAPAVVKPGSFENSVMLLRMNTIDECCSMPPLAKGIVDDVAVSRVADWILGMDADSCTHIQGFYGAAELGISGPPPAGAAPDTWHSNIVVNEDDTFTNSTGAALTLTIDRFLFHAGRSGDPVTPFVVKVNGNNNFTVLAIGTPRLNYVTGSNNVFFSDGPSKITLAPGQTIAIGFIDANPNGSGGSLPGIIDWVQGSTEVWRGGGPTDANAGSVTLGQMPAYGAQLVTNSTRNYQFAISYIISGYEIGNGLAVQSGAGPDGANSNLVINETDTFTNTTGTTMTVTVEEFRFHAGRVTDPVTPFLVKVNADNDFTVLAVGSPRSSYVLGNNSFPFSAVPVRLTLPPGTKIAAGFIDYLPDGSGGTGQGVVNFKEGGDQIYYSYDVTNAGSIVTAGQAPIPKGYQHTDLQRNYFFSVTLGFGGKEDEDGDGLPDSWELAYVPSVTGLSATADTDHDGTSDAAEHEAGTDPTDPGSVLMGLGVTKNNEGAGVSAILKTVPGRYYKAEISADLQNWIPAGSFRAASWPATETRFTIPAAALPAGSEATCFARFEPAAAAE